MIKNIIKILVLLLIIYSANPTYALGEKSTIRVAISNQTFSNFEYKTISLVADDAMKVIDMSASASIEEIKPQTTLKIEYSQESYSLYLNEQLKYKNLKGPLLISSNSPIGILGLNRKGTPAKYLGMMEIRTSKNNNGFNIINVVSLIQNL